MAFDSERTNEERLDWLEAAVRRIATSVTPSVTLPPRPGADPGQLSAEVQELVRAGQTIQAVQLHRSESGIGLAEAKAAVDSFSG